MSENSNTSRRAMDIIRRYVIPAALSIGLIATILWATQERARAERSETLARSMYQRAYGELTDDLYNLQTALGKLMAVNSPAQYVLLLDEVWRLSGSAVSNMSMMPVSHVDTTELNQFIVRLGDYAHALTKKAARGGMITPEDTDNIAALRDSCAELAAQYEQNYSQGNIPLEALSADGYFSQSEEYKDPEGVAQFPTLIYDGPFSESSEKLEPRGLKGGEVSREEAEKAAESVSGLDMEFSGDNGGKIPAYDFSYADEGGSWAEASVSRQGGKLIWYMASVSGGAEGKPGQSAAEQYVRAAERRLSELGYGAMVPTYAQYYGGAAVINFAATQDGVILYSDLIKVWVDRENLKVTGIDARNYLFSHVERQLAHPAISQEEAESLLSSNLKVEDRAVALIPVTPETETLCYEFKCSLGEEAYIVYINALNGDEEQIFKIIDSEEGQMVI